MHGNADKLDGKESSEFILKDNITILRGKISATGSQGSTSVLGQATINFPEGFNTDNCVVISTSLKLSNNENFAAGFETISSYKYPAALLNGGLGKNILFRKQTNDMLFTIMFEWDSNLDEDKVYDYDYEIVLMKYKISNTEYTLGDVNGDGEITQDDLTMINNYLLKTTALTEQQFIAADVTKDGKIDSADVNKLNKYIQGTITSLE